MEQKTSKFIREQVFIDGNWVTGSAKKDSLPVLNPATNQMVGQVPNCGAEETLQAIKAAKDAFPTWSRTSSYCRAALLQKFAGSMREQQKDLAHLLTSEQGKPIKEAASEINYAADYFEWFGEEAKRLYGETIPASHTYKRLLVQREAVGVCAAITPWNFPSAMLARKMAAALSAGCTFISRPATETPLSALALGVIAQEVGIPNGVINIITGESEPIAKALMQSTEVRKISFTGSTEVGKILMRQSAETLKRLTLELGGNAPFIVFEDADLDKACQDAILAKYRNAGQTCVCVNRFLVHQDVAEEFTEKLAAASRALRVGNGHDPETDIGPLISLQASDKVRELVDDALVKGAALRLGGKSDPNTKYIYPTIITNVTDKMRICHEEVFGPVSAIQTFSSEEEAIAIANNTEYGLASYFYTRDLSRAFRISEALEYGMVGVNDTAISCAQAPFGGIKQSGFGREGSRHGLDEYTNLKYVSIGIG